MKKLTPIFTGLKEFVRSGNYWKIVGIGLAVAITGLIFGIAFMLIFVGVFSLLHRLTPYWQPANKLFGKLSLGNLETPDPVRGWKWAELTLTAIPPIILILGGLYILARTGIANQNLILLLMKK